MIYHSFAAMARRARSVVDGWRESYGNLKTGTNRQRRIYREIEDGFRDIPAGNCTLGANRRARRPGVTRAMGAVRMHQWQVTNEMYEEFDPGHANERWLHSRASYCKLHPLVRFYRRRGDDRCPVVNVTWFDAWCFAAWCGKRLPTTLEWEYAYRAGSSGDFSVAVDEGGKSFEVTHKTLGRVAWRADNSGGHTHPVGELLPNAHGLRDMNGNACEWCDDRVGPGASASGASWASVRDYPLFGFVRQPSFRGDYYGFRLAAAPVGAKSGAQE